MPIVSSSNSDSLNRFTWTMFYAKARKNEKFIEGHFQRQLIAAGFKGTKKNDDFQTSEL